MNKQSNRVRSKAYLQDEYAHIDARTRFVVADRTPDHRMSIELYTFALANGPAISDFHRFNCGRVLVQNIPPAPLRSCRCRDPGLLSGRLRREVWWRWRWRWLSRSDG